MSYVLDTNVVSALRVPTRNPRVAKWAATIPLAELWITAPTVAEIERGIIAREISDPRAGKLLRDWFERGVLAAFSARILPLDLPAARALARFNIPAEAPLDDALIAAIAQSRAMTVVTRNIKHFAPLGVPLINPWDEGIATR